jgi:hypothetical protein
VVESHSLDCGFIDNKDSSPDDTQYTGISDEECPGNSSDNSGSWSEHDPPFNCKYSTPDDKSPCILVDSLSCAATGMAETTDGLSFEPVKLTTCHLMPDRRTINISHGTGATVFKLTILTWWTYSRYDCLIRCGMTGVMPPPGYNLVRQGFELETLAGRLSVWDIEKGSQVGTGEPLGAKHLFGWPLPLPYCNETIPDLTSNAMNRELAEMQARAEANARADAEREAAIREAEARAKACAEIHACTWAVVQAKIEAAQSGMVQATSAGSNSTITSQAIEGTNNSLPEMPQVDTLTLLDSSFHDHSEFTDPANLHNLSSTPLNLNSVTETKKTKKSLRPSPYKDARKRSNPSHYPPSSHFTSNDSLRALLTENADVMLHSMIKELSESQQQAIQHKNSESARHRIVNRG